MNIFTLFEQVFKNKRPSLKHNRVCWYRGNIEEKVKPKIDCLPITRCPKNIPKNYPSAYFFLKLIKKDTHCCP